MKKFLSNLVYILLIIFFACSKNDSNPQATGPTIQDELQDALNQVFVQNGGKGISAAVAFPDGSVWSGCAHASGTSTISSDHLFWIGSITKMYTATVILQLVEEGILNLNDRIDQYLPSYRYVDGNITIKELLLHTAGLFDFTNHPEYYEMVDEDRSKVWSPADILSRLLLDPLFTHGCGWSYSNTNYTLLGMIVEEVTGNQISEEFRNRLYNPLSLHNTFLDCQEVTAGVIAPFWINMDDDAELEEFFAPYELRASETSVAFSSGGLFATAEDCARFTHALLRGDLLSENTMNQMLDFYTDMPDDWDDRGYGLGVNWIRLSMVNGAEAYGHGGNAYHLSATAYLRDYDITVTILQNYPNNWALWENSMAALCRVIMEFYD